jgi:DNA-binding NarL/FixJ family response regulator
MARVLIVDDHPLFRRGLRAVIEQEPGLQVCGEAADAGEALRQVSAHEPDLVIVDVSLKKGHGLELVKQIRARDKHVKMLMCSMHDDQLFAERALNAGALGYVNKGEAPETILGGIRAVLHGSVYLSDEVSRRILTRGRRAAGATTGRLGDSLSDRELAVFELIGRGLTTRAIAEQLYLSVKTVETYREHIKVKLGLKNGAELARHATQWVLERA